MQRFHLLAFGKQFFAATRRLLVIERLSVRQRLAYREDVNPSIHICMDQTGQLEIPGHREDDGKGLPRHHRRRGDASRTIEDGWITRKARAPHIETGRTWPALRKVTVCVSSAWNVQVILSPRSEERRVGKEMRV